MVLLSKQLMRLAGAPGTEVGSGDGSGSVIDNGSGSVNWRRQRQAAVGGWRGRRRGRALCSQSSSCCWDAPPAQGSTPLPHLASLSTAAHGEEPQGLDEEPQGPK